MIYYIDLVGFYGPLLIGLINTIWLWYRKIYLISYLLCLVANTVINNILKNIIQEPRPSGQIYLNEQLDKGPISYGMPSGHAQSVGFSITFLYLAVHSPAILYVSIFIGSLTLYQRYTYMRHTLSQLFAGLILGTIIGLISYRTTYALVNNKNIILI